MSSVGPRGQESRAGCPRDWYALALASDITYEILAVPSADALRAFASAVLRAGAACYVAGDSNVKGEIAVRDVEASALFASMLEGLALSEGALVLHLVDRALG
jgi:hypothetical protein